MSKRDKINFIKSRTGIIDDNIAEHFLNLTNGNQNDAVQLYLSEKQVEQNNNFYNNINNQINTEFIINDEILLNQEVHIPNDKSFYDDLKTFFFEKFTYISTSLDNFLLQLKKHAGLVIILSRSTHFNARNDMIRVIQNQLCQDIIQNVVIFPVMNDSKIGIELLKKCNSRNFPLYLFCKYKNNYTINISYKLEQHFNDVNAVNFFLDCFPESDLRQSVFRNLNETVANLRNSIIIGNNINNNLNNQNNLGNNANINISNNNNDNKNKNILADSKNYFDGSIDDLNRLIEKCSRLNDNQQNNNINNNIQNSLNNQQNNNIINNQSQNDINDININNSNSSYNNKSNNNSINNNQNHINYNNSSNNINNNNNQSINQVNINNSNINNSINNRSQIQNSISNPILRDSIYGLSDGQIMAKREREIKELERQHEEKIKKEEEEKQKKLNEENEIKAKNEQYEKEALLCKQNLPEEPEENDPNVCIIMFKYPNGEKNIEKRFLKSDKIIVLYNYVKSLGREIFSENTSYNFDLIQGLPYKNFEESKNKTLEEEGLFPRSMIIIKEKEK